MSGNLQDILPVKAYNAAKTLVLTSGVVLMSGILLLVLFYVMSSPTFGWTGETSSCRKCLEAVLDLLTLQIPACNLIIVLLPFQVVVSAFWIPPTPPSTFLSLHQSASTSLQPGRRTSLTCRLPASSCLLASSPSSGL